MFIHLLLVVICKIICVLISVAYFTIAERKIMASIQRSLGPNIEGGFIGLFQPLFDGLKLFLKELIIPSRANIFIFLLSPLFILCLSLTAWVMIPFSVSNQFKMFLVFEHLYTKKFKGYYFSNINFGIFFLLALSSLNVYGMILGGWASNSKYAFLGALRSSSQMISYEVSIGLTILPVILLSGSFNLSDIILLQYSTVWYFLPLLPCSIIFFISMLAETNRSPFDLPEAEAELVAGYNVEYGAMFFALFFLGEYSNMLLMSTLIVILFFGGWLLPFINFSFCGKFFNVLVFVFKLIIFCFLYILVRASFPRYRYDQLMSIGWKIFLPLTLGFFFFCICFSVSWKLLIIGNFANGWMIY